MRGDVAFQITIDNSRLNRRDHQLVTHISIVTVSTIRLYRWQ